VENLNPIRQLIRGIMVGLFIMVMINYGGILEAEERLLPLDQELATTMLEKILTQKLVGREFTDDDLRVTITRVNRFVMDWETSRFMINCEFQVSYQKSFITLNEGGEVSLEGIGLISSEEQKLGVKLNRVNHLRLNRINKAINTLVTKVLNNMLDDKVFWPEKAPSQFVLLSKVNLDTMIQVTLNRILPQKVSGNRIHVTLNRVQQLAFTGEPGGVRTVVNFEGQYDRLLKVSFSGRVGAVLQVMVDPDTFSGIIRVQQVTDVKVDRRILFIDNILQMMIEAKLQGREVRFSWK